MVRLPRQANPQALPRRPRQTSQGVMPRIAVAPTLTTMMMGCFQMVRASNHPTVQGFQGWSDDEAEGDEPTAMANIVKCLEEDQHDSSVSMGR